MGEFNITVDQRKNRIILHLTGYQTLDEAQAFKKEYGNAIAKCHRGFTVLTYAAGYKPGSAEVQKIHADCIKMDAVAGVRKVARVVGETPLGGEQIRRLSTAVREYRAENFKTTAEAEAYLDRESD